MIIKKEFGVSLIEFIIYLYFLKFYYKLCLKKEKYIKLFRFKNFAQNIIYYKSNINNYKQIIENYNIPVIYTNLDMFVKNKILGYIQLDTYVYKTGEEWNNLPFYINNNISDWFINSEYISEEQYNYYQKVIHFDKLFGEIINYYILKANKIITK